MGVHLFVGDCALPFREYSERSTCQIRYRYVARGAVGKFKGLEASDNQERISTWCRRVVARGEKSKDRW